MNSIISEYYGLFEHYQALRSQMMAILTDDDLRVTPGGNNPSLGELCLENGEVQQGYIDSFTSFILDFSYRAEDPAVAGSVARLTEWYEQLDRKLKEVVAGLTEDELEQQQIDRLGGFYLPPRIHLEVYQEALLIFYGKASVYLKLLGKDLPRQWRQWIG